MAPLAGPMHGSLYIRRACPRSPLTRLHHSTSGHGSTVERSSFVAPHRRRGITTAPNAHRPFLSLSTNLQTSHTQTTHRVKSTWARSSASSASYSGTHWCRPGCRWIRNETEVDPIQRNKENPVPDDKQYELSDRELKWQQHIDSISTFIAKDPYRFLFGASDDRLKGIFPRVDWAQEMFPWWKDELGKPEAKTEVTRQEEKGASELLKSNDNPVGTTQDKFHVASFPPPAFVAPGDFTFDPITMRMVRKPMSESIASNPAVSSSVTPSTVKDAVKKSGRRPIMSPSEYKQWSASRLQQKLPAVSTGTVALAAKSTVEPARPIAPACASSNPRATVVSTTGEAIVERPAWAKTALERSWALENKNAASAGRRSVPAEPVTAKAVLENSWKKENSAVSQDRITPSSRIDSAAPTIKTSIIPKPQDERIALISTWLDIKNNGVVNPAARAALYNKNTPLTSMSYSDFRKHQATLIASWKQKTVPKPSSALEQKLQDEIKTQKMAMTAFEDKWHLRDRPTQAVAAPMLHHASDATATKSADIVAKEAQKSRDDALVREIRGIYEGFYGPIGEAGPNIGAKSLGAAQANRWIPDADAGVNGQSITIDGLDRSQKCRNPVKTALQETAASVRVTDQAPIDVAERQTLKSHDEAVDESDRLPSKAQASSVKIHRASSGSTRVRRMPQEFKDAEQASRVDFMPESKRTNVMRHKESKAAERIAPDACFEANEFPSRADTIALAAQPTRVDRVASPYDSLSARIDQPNSSRSHYQILAYDPSDNAVHTASASQTYTPPTGDKFLGLTDALTRLHAPAKFLPLLTECQKHGYEIVCASGNLLILKREGCGRGEESIGREGGANAGAKMNGSDLVDGTGAAPPEPATGNFASPTGFVNHDAIFSGPSAARPRQSGRIVRKEEPVFSGTSLRSCQDAREPVTPAGSFGRSPKSPNADELQQPTGRTSRFATEFESIPPPPPPPLPLSGRSKEHPSKGSADESRSVPRQALLWAGGLVAACYAVGVVVEDLRERAQLRHYEERPYAREPSSPLFDRWRDGSAAAASGSRGPYWPSTQARRGFWGMETPAGEVMVWGALLAPLAVWWFVR